MKGTKGQPERIDGKPDLDFGLMEDCISDRLIPLMIVGAHIYFCQSLISSFSVWEFPRNQNTKILRAIS